VADELERIHRAGPSLERFRRPLPASTRIAIIWWRQLSQRKIPFVISNLSILEHPLVRDVLAYLRLIATPFDNIACARVSPRPAWYLTAEDLVRLTERTRKKAWHPPLRHAASATRRTCVRPILRCVQNASGILD